jgi:heme-degrading monooxygenase HmoA
MEDRVPALPRLLAAVSSFRIDPGEAGTEVMMHARVTTIEMDPAKIDETVAMVEEEDLPGWKGLDGFKGFTLVVDRKSGRVIGTSYWATPEQMQNSEDAVSEARQRAADTGGAKSPPQVERFEVALDTFVK